MPEFEEILHDQIDNYLTGRMTAAEKAEFESKMAGDPLLKEEVDFQRKVMGAIQHARKEELKDFIRQSVAQEKRKNLSRPWWLSVAAAVLIISMVSIYFVRNNETETQLAQEKPLNDETTASPPKIIDSENANEGTAGNSESTKPEEKGQFAQVETTEKKEGVLPPPLPTTKKLALLKDTVLFATIIETQESDEILRAAESRNNPQGKIKVEFWSGAEGEHGYIFYNDKLKLFGLGEEKISLLQYKRRYYLKQGNNFYSLIPQNKLNKFVPVKDAATISALNSK